MRQIHNHGTPQDKAVEQLKQHLTAAGLTPANIAWLVPYLDMTQPEQPELLQNAQKQSVRALDPNQCVQFASLINNRLLSRNNAKGITQEGKDLQDRTIQAFFAIFGPGLVHGTVTSARSWLNYGPALTSNPKELDRLLGEGAALALKASYWCGGSNTADSLKAAKPEMIEKALAYCTDTADSARIVLACLWLAKQSGLLNMLNNPKRQEMIQIVQDGAAALLPEIAPGLNPSDQTILARYMKQDNLDALPVKLQKIATASAVTSSAYSMGSRTSDTSAVGSACFLAMNAVPAFQTIFIVCAALHTSLTLQLSLDLAGEVVFLKKIPWLIEHTAFYALLPRLCQSSPAHPIASHIARQYPEQFDKALKGQSYYQAKNLLAVLRTANPEHEKRYQAARRPGEQQQAAKDVTEKVPGFDAAEERELWNFVLNGGDLSGLLAKHPLSPDNNKGGAAWGYRSNAANYGAQYGLDPFLARCIIAMMFSGNSYHLTRAWDETYRNLPEAQKHMGTLLDAVSAEGLPLFACLILPEWEDAHSYSSKDKDEIVTQTVNWMLRQPEDLIAQAAAKGSAYVRTLGAKALEKKGDYDALLPLAQDSSKQVRKAVVDAFAAKPFAEGPKAAMELLTSKKAAARETGINILVDMEMHAAKKGVYAEQYRTQLEDALAKEKSVKLANALRAILGMEAVQTEGKPAAKVPGDPVAEVLKGGKKRKIQWVLDGVSREPGSILAAEEDRLAAVMLCCIDSGGLSFARTLPDAKGQTYEQAAALAISRNVEAAKKLAEPLDAAALAEFAERVFNLWLEQNAPSKQKWVLTFSAVFGGHAMVDNLKRQISQWPLNSRGAIACDAVNALAISPEPEALLIVDSISRKFKFKQVKAAAGKALDFAAQALGLSSEELADRIVPDLGLDQRGQRVFNYGPRSFTVTLTPALELEVQNQDGKKVKSMPAPGKQDDPALANEASAEFKALKKQIKATVSTQTLRLEQALSTGRVWTGAGWRELFVEKPIMRQFAVGLVWGVYGEGGTLSDTFRYLEDGSLNTADEDEYELAGDACVGLVHPVELSKEALDAWKQQLEDYEIKQPIEQLTRPVSRVTEEQKDETSLDTFGGRVLNDMSLSGKLLGMGWYRGSVQDAGGFYDFYREDGPIGAQLNFSGSFVGGGYDDEVTVYDIQFYRSGTVRRGSYVYDTLGRPDSPDAPKEAAGTGFVLVGGVRQPSDQRLIPLGAVPARLFSEIVYQVQKATASSTETRENWKTERMW